VAPGRYSEGGGSADEPSYTEVLPRLNSSTCSQNNNNNNLSGSGAPRCGRRQRHGAGVQSSWGCVLFFSFFYCDHQGAAPPPPPYGTASGSLPVVPDLE